MQTIRKTVTRREFSRDKGWQDVTLHVKLVIDDDAIIERLAVRAYKKRAVHLLS